MTPGWSTPNSGRRPELHQGDVCNAFYHVALPSSMRVRFGMPKVRVADLGRKVAHRAGLRYDSWVVPQLTVLPMGWAWSLYFMQNILELGVEVSF